MISKTKEDLVKDLLLFVLDTVDANSLVRHYVYGSTKLTPTYNTYSFTDIRITSVLVPSFKQIELVLDYVNESETYAIQEGFIFKETFIRNRLTEQRLFKLHIHLIDNNNDRLILTLSNDDPFIKIYMDNLDRLNNIQTQLDNNKEQIKLANLKTLIDNTINGARG